MDNTNISRAKEDRVDKQYYVDFAVNQLEAKEAIRIAEEFITEMNHLIDTLTETQVQSYHDKAVAFFTPPRV